MDETLKKEVMALKSQGYTETQIKQFLTQKGYLLQQINEAISGIVKENNKQAKPKSKKTIVIIISMISLIIFILIIIIINNINKENYEYKVEPKNWIETNKENFTINIENIPDGYREYSRGTQQFANHEIRTEFIIEGWYNGEYFREDYSENDKILLSLDNKINPNDDILNIFITETFIDNQPYFEIFLDKLWKDKLGEINIIYGKDFENNIKFNFSSQNEIKKGIYYNKIKDDKSRFNLNSNPTQTQGGLIIGNMTSNDYFDKNPYEKIIIKFS